MITRLMRKMMLTNDHVINVVVGTRTVVIQIFRQ